MLDFSIASTLPRHSQPAKSSTPLIRRERQVALNPDLSGERRSPIVPAPLSGELPGIWETRFHYLDPFPQAVCCSVSKAGRKPLNCLMNHGRLSTPMTTAQKIETTKLKGTTALS